LKSWLGYNTDILRSPLPMPECLDRLRAAIEDEEGDSRVVGKVVAQSLRLRKRLPEESHNSFQTYLNATVEPDGAATRLVCRFGPHPLVIVFVLFWCLSLVGVTVAIKLVAAPDLPAAALAVPVIMALMAVAIVGGGRRFARDERGFLLDFLRETIDARSLAARVESVVRR